MDLLDRADVKGSVELEGLPHGGDVADDELGVARGVWGQFGEGDVAGTRGEAFDLRACRGLAPEQHGGEVVAARLLLGVKPGEFHEQLGHACGEL